MKNSKERNYKRKWKETKIRDNFVPEQWFFFRDVLFFLSPAITSFNHLPFIFIFFLLCSHQHSLFHLVLYVYHLSFMSILFYLSHHSLHSTFILLSFSITSCKVRTQDSWSVDHSCDWRKSPAAVSTQWSSLSLCPAAIVLCFYSSFILGDHRIGPQKIGGGPLRGI